jgi:hypothetical protein
MLGIGGASLFTQHITFAANASFHLEEATIADVQRAIRAKEITATQLVNLYFKRIEAYNGKCVKGDVDPTTGLMLGDLTPIENAGQINAYMTLNIRVTTPSTCARPRAQPPTTPTTSRPRMPQSLPSFAPQAQSSWARPIWMNMRRQASAAARDREPAKPHDFE